MFCYFNLTLFSPQNKRTQNRIYSPGQGIHYIIKIIIILIKKDKAVIDANISTRYHRCTDYHIPTELCISQNLRKGVTVQTVCMHAFYL